MKKNLMANYLSLLAPNSNPLCKYQIKVVLLDSMRSLAPITWSWPVCNYDRNKCSGNSRRICQPKWEKGEKRRCHRHRRIRRWLLPFSFIHWSLDIYKSVNLFVFASFLSVNRLENRRFSSKLHTPKYTLKCDKWTIDFFFSLTRLCAAFQQGYRLAGSIMNFPGDVLCQFFTSMLWSSTDPEISLR